MFFAQHLCLPLLSRALREDFGETGAVHGINDMGSTSAQTGASCSKAGAPPIRQAMDKWLRQLLPETAITLCRNLRAWPSSGIMTVGTAFTGCDILAKCLEQCEQAWQEFFGAICTFDMKFGCEVVEDKRKFLHTQFPELPCIYEQVEDLSQLSAYNWVKENMEVVPHVCGFAAGFTCRSRSPSNSSAAKNKGCIRAGSDSSGKAFHATQQYIEKSRPEWVLLENITPLLQDGPDSDSAYIKEWFASIGYACECFVVAAEKYGSRVVRVRLYFVAFDVRMKLSIADSMFDNIRRALSCMEIDPLPMDLFLCDPSPPVDYTSRKAAKTDPKYQDEHMALFKNHSLPWPPDLGKAPGYLHDVLGVSTPRMQEVIIYLDRVFPWEQGPGHVEFIDVNCSLGRLVNASGTSPWHLDKVGAITTTMKLLKRSQKTRDSNVEYEFVHGISLMALTGWSPCMFIDNDFGKLPSNEELIHFAGNAYNCFALGAIIIAMFTVWPLGLRQGEDASKGDAHCDQSDESEDAFQSSDS